VTDVFVDGAALLSIQIAQDKAYTAAGFGMPSGGWHYTQDMEVAEAGLAAIG
jgi:uncharacterized protein GlcG (DUF336 family)